MMKTWYIERKDFPAWIAKVEERENQRPKQIPVTVEGHVTVGRSWHERNRETVYVYNTKTGEFKGVKGSWGGQNAFAQGAERAVNEGIGINLYDHIMVATVSTYPKSIKLYVPPSMMPDLLPAPVGEELSPEDLMVLTCIKCLIPKARRDAFERNTVVSPGYYDAALPDLIRGGYLNKNGSISAKGRNAVGNMRPESLYDDLADAGRL